MNILFLCVANSARSQIAEGLARSMFGADSDIRSAGSSPSGLVHPNAVSTMNEIGIDISSHRSKSIDDIEEDFMNNLDYVITLCAEEICPVINSNAEMLHWINTDPDNSSLNTKELESSFRQTRKNIYKLLKKFLILNS
tara:strand:+ start:235 stop:651 length:417 start_codon:yes stop_codon:yes gene_type:complete